MKTNISTSTISRWPENERSLCYYSSITFTKWFVCVQAYVENLEKEVRRLVDENLNLKKQCKKVLKHIYWSCMSKECLVFFGGQCDEHFFSFLFLFFAAQLKLEVAALVLPTKSSLRRTSSTQFWRDKETWTYIFDSSTKLREGMIGFVCTFSVSVCVCVNQGNGRDRLGHQCGIIYIFFYLFDT